MIFFSQPSGKNSTTHLVWLISIARFQVTARAPEKVFEDQWFTPLWKSETVGAKAPGTERAINRSPALVAIRAPLVMVVKKRQNITSSKRTSSCSICVGLETASTGEVPLSTGDASTIDALVQLRPALFLAVGFLGACCCVSISRAAFARSRFFSNRC
jgi:hypothetical protein